MYNDHFKCDYFPIVAKIRLLKESIVLLMDVTRLRNPYVYSFLRTFLFD